MNKLAELETLFLTALETESLEQRAAFLDRACAKQPAARQDLERMLAAHAQLGDFLNQPAIALLPGNCERDLAFLQPAAKAGSLGRLAHYEILEVIGRGGCGIVLKATDEKLQRIVAIKAMAFPWTASSTARKRFLREARAAAAISHDNVVPIHAVEEEGSVPYLVMQYVAGESLEEKLRREGTIGLAEVLRIGVQVAEGLAAAHAQGIVHRDIKPANILLEGKSGRVKITDFGLAHAIDDSSAGGERIIAGTPDYMAPEQARGEAVNHQADLFSFGCVLYRITTGKSPFNGAQTAMGGRVATVKKPKPPRQLNPEVPTALSELIMRLLALAPNDRPQSAREVADALQRIDGSQGFRQIRERLREIAMVGGVALALLLLAGICLYGPTVYRLVTNQGQLVVESDDPDVKVVVKQDQQAITVLDAKTQHEVTLKAGKYHAELESAKLGLGLSAKEFNLTRGDKQSVRVQWLPPGPIQTMEGHQDIVWSAAFCLGGTHVISVGGGRWEEENKRWLKGSDFKLRLWDARTGREVRRFGGHAQEAGRLAVSPDGTRVVSAAGEGSDDGGSDCTLRLWDLQTGELIRRFETRHTHAVTGRLAFSADGKRVVSTSMDKSVRLWDVESGQEIRSFLDSDAACRAVDISRDGKRILWGSDDWKLRLSNAETGEIIWVLDAYKAWGLVDLSPDERFALTMGLTPEGRSNVELWNLDAGKLVRQFRHETGWIGHSGFSPNGKRFLSHGQDGTLRLWQVATGKELCRFETPPSPATANAIATSAFSPDGRFAVSAGWDHIVRIWKLPEKD